VLPDLPPDSRIAFRALARALDLIVDTRNAMNGVAGGSGIIVKA